MNGETETFNRKQCFALMVGLTLAIAWLLAERIDRAPVTHWPDKVVSTAEKV